MSRTLEEIAEGLANVLCLLAPNERITILAALSEAREGALREAAWLHDNVSKEMRARILALASSPEPAPKRAPPREPLPVRTGPPPALEDYQDPPHPSPVDDRERCPVCGGPCRCCPYCSRNDGHDHDCTPEKRAAADPSPVEGDGAREDRVAFLRTLAGDWARMAAGEVESAWPASARRALAMCAGAVRHALDDRHAEIVRRLAALSERESGGTTRAGEGDDHAA